MAYVDLNSVQNPAPGLTVLSAWGDQVRDNFEALLRPAFCRVNDGFEIVPDATPTTVVFPNQDWDTAGMFTPGDNKVFITQTGLYVITATAEWQAEIGGRRHIDLSANIGGTLGRVDYPAGPNGDSAIALTLHPRIHVNGDYIQMSVYQDTGVAVQALCCLSVLRIGTV